MQNLHKTYYMIMIMIISLTDYIIIYHPGLAEIPAPDESQEVVVHTHKCSLSEAQVS